jgi:flagellar biosynthesis GTPase FlhF
LLNVLDEPSQLPSPALSFRDYGKWRAGSVLESMGFLPFQAQKVVARLQMLHGETPPHTLADELHLIRCYLQDAWPKPIVKPDGISRPHVLVGAHGSGKSTVLCKWMTHAVLLEPFPVRVLKLDGRTANTADFVNFHCEAMGVKLERSIPKNTPAEHVVFVDLPGINWRDPGSLQELFKLASELPNAELHLVLNAAYDTNVILAQVRAFSSLPIADLIFTHLDEETRWAKLWNFVLGTKFTVRFLSTGQNIPSGFLIPTPDHLFSTDSHCP